MANKNRIDFGVQAVRRKNMSEIASAEWFAILEAASRRPPDECNAEWEWLMKELGLGPEYFPAIYETLQQGRWRTARNPKAYIKTVAKRVAVKMDMRSRKSAELVFPAGIELEGEELSQGERLDYILHQQDSIEPIKGADGVWRSGPGWDRDYEDEREEYESYRDFLVAKVPGDLASIEFPSQEDKAAIEDFNNSADEVHVHLRPLPKPDWPKWAEAAGLDEWERRVLGYKLAGVSRERGVEAQPDEVSRKALQAAWKRFARNGISRLLAVVKKNSEENVPE